MPSHVFVSIRTYLYIYVYIHPIPARGMCFLNTSSWPSKCEISQLQLSSTIVIIKIVIDCIHWVTGLSKNSLSVLVY